MVHLEYLLPPEEGRIMTKLSTITLPTGGTLFVEVEEVDLPSITAAGSAKRRLPKGAEEVGAVQDAVQLIKESLVGLGEMVKEGLEKSRPDQWGIEVNFGFKGKTNLVPVLVSSEANVAIKVTATWKRSGSGG